ncbi:MAG: hypothetical protein HYZ13_15260 [Acidobacteria bacterium]|nr:hypothetical protein [Acidobacteriota bacterium]
MKFEIRCNDAVIGHSDLEAADLGMGILHGEFLPTAAYEGVRPIFQLFGDASPESAPSKSGESAKLEAFRAQVEELDLEVWHRSGENLPVAEVHIHDFSAELGLESECQVEVHILDRASWLPFLGY